ncbi:hypothetical protein PPACK8108_LOCUS6656 [Phakopsora pachyrhizi]|uniref:CRAL-TRIO domain-containing protein n=1 Tax=Phakopsora pachyrhizi TaxID=170000 RepID=A0AAV0AUR7_PHAPC|nr:hypothetical protein PPACK8108_LOCUS6656 [Phakopsora pachyrhizi]
MSRTITLPSDPLTTTSSNEEFNRLPSNGLKTRLTRSQFESLKSFWSQLFRLIDRQPDGRPGTKGKKDNVAVGGCEHEGGGAESVGVNPSNVQNQSGDTLEDRHEFFEAFGINQLIECFSQLIMMDDPDVIILKFLRARKWNVSEALRMMLTCLKWRVDFGVEGIIRRGEDVERKKKQGGGKTDIVNDEEREGGGLVLEEDGEEGEGFLNQLRVGKSFVQGVDRLGRPVVYINVKLHKASDQSLRNLEEFIVYGMEVVRLMLRPPLIEKATIVIDMTGFGMANMDWKSLAFIIKCLEAYYPESLNVLIVHNPPWVFHGLWKVIAPMLDLQFLLLLAVVRSKIQMTKSTDELKVHIDEKKLISSLGGSNRWKWNYVEPSSPSTSSLSDEDEEMRRICLEREVERRRKLMGLYLEYTRRWATQKFDGQLMVLDDLKFERVNDKTRVNFDDEDGYLIFEDCSLVSRIRNFLNLRLRVHYFTLDGFLRSRTIYHRTGRIVGNGLISFEYPRVSNGDLTKQRPETEKKLKKQSNPRRRGLRLGKGDDEDDEVKVNGIGEDGEIDFVDVLGYEMCKEKLEFEIYRMRRKFEQENRIAESNGYDGTEDFRNLKFLQEF